MRKKIEILFDIYRHPYLGLRFYPYELEEALNCFRQLVGKEDFEIYSHYRQLRDGDNYHITFAPRFEYEQLGSVEGIVVEVKFQGIGKIEQEKKTTFFIIAQSEDLNQIRRQAGLEPKDFHLTLGFNPKDIYGVSKGIETMIHPF